MHQSPNPGQSLASVELTPGNQLQGGCETDKNYLYLSVFRCVDKIFTMNIKIHRIYEYTEPQSEIRILVDKLWPRGISKAEARLDDWWKDIAPSSKLRIWYGHDTDKWDEFREKYTDELEKKKDLIGEKLAELDKRKTIVLLYGAKDKDHNQAIVLKEFLENNFQG